MVYFKKNKFFSFPKELDVQKAHMKSEKLSMFEKMAQIYQELPFP